MARNRLFSAEQPLERSFTWGDALILATLAIALYLGARLAMDAPDAIRGPEIKLTVSALPWYALLSLGRMLVAYTLSLLFTLIYGRIAAYNRRAEQVMIPLLDVLQSVPILSFLPVVLLSLSAILPEGIAVELAAIVLIFTSQVWHLTFAWYQSLTTIPNELREASAIFRFGGWMQFRTMELPFAAISLIWNSIMSWAGGWFFLMAAEIFTVGQRDFRLPGLGAYLQEAANQGNQVAIAWGLLTLLIVIVSMDQLIWRPLLAWADRFKIETVEEKESTSSWFYNLLRNARLIAWLDHHIGSPLQEWIDGWLTRQTAVRPPDQGRGWSATISYLFLIGWGAGLLYGLYRAMEMLLRVSAAQWIEIGVSVGATLLRVIVALLIALAWTIPLGVLIGTKPRWAAIFQPLAQILASIPATALFPIFLVFLLRIPAGLDVAAVVLMLTGTQWYLLFNVIAGASAIPQDLKYTSSLLQLKRGERWRTLILPSLFPYLITGAITASGGAWNASIVAEHVEFAGENYRTIGIGALIANATAIGDYPLLLAGTMTMILSVVLINRLIWRRLYRLAEDRYRME
ncbi:MAG: ABC transporter permease subunit [Caldilineaceae bacterium]|nr:ABC transporter permease subunit [Caldilineaceae bacterium]